jgi:hypothetical protein
LLADIRCGRCRDGRDCSLAVALKGDLLDPGRTFNERSANMVDQKQGTAGKDEKSGKPVGANQKRDAIGSTPISTENDPATNAAPATPTKMELATEIYKRMRTVKDVTRKDIIEKFIAEVKLTKAGASTYYQLINDRQEP